MTHSTVIAGKTLIGSRWITSLGFEIENIFCLGSAKILDIGFGSIHLLLRALSIASFCYCGPSRSHENHSLVSTGFANARQCSPRRGGSARCSRPDLYSRRGHSLGMALGRSEPLVVASQRDRAPRQARTAGSLQCRATRTPACHRQYAEIFYDLPSLVSLVWCLRRSDVQTTSDACLSRYSSSVSKALRKS